MRSFQVARPLSNTLLNSNDGGDPDFVESSASLMQRQKQKAKQKAKRDDMDSIDWMKDKANARMRSMYLNEFMKRANLLQKFKIYLEKLSIWFILILLGCVGGITAFLVNLGAQYLSDLRQGMCLSNFLYKKEDCCWSSSHLHLEGSLAHLSCDDWRTWGELMVGAGANGTALSKMDDTIIYSANYIMFMVVPIVYVLFAFFVVKQLAPYAAGGGIAEIKTILGGFIIHGFLGFSTYVFKSITLIPTVASGLVLGQEGPMVHIACCLANVISRMFPAYKDNEAKRREVLSAGAAAGVAIAFRAPIGGVLFSYEEISYYFPVSTLWRTFFCCLIGAFTLSLLDPYFNGRLVLYYIEYTTAWKPFEILFLLALGVLGGLYGALFTKCSLKWNEIKEKMPVLRNPLVYVVLLTLLTNVLSYPHEYTRISNHHLLDTLFTNCKGSKSDPFFCYGKYNDELEQYFTLKYQILGLILAIVLKGTLFIFTQGIKIPMGMFIPSLTIGACTGRLLGIILERLVETHPTFFLFASCAESSQNCVLPGTYAVVGAAAFLTGVCQITVSMVVIMVELTGQMTYIVPIMLAVFTSKFVFSLFRMDGLNEAMILKRSFPYLEEGDDVPMESTVEAVMRPREGERLTVFYMTGMRVEEIRSLVENTLYKGFPVVEGDASENRERLGRFYGYVSRNALLAALQLKKQEYGSQFVNAQVDFGSRRTSNRRQGGQPVVPLNDIVELNNIAVSKNTSMEMAYHIFRKLGVRMVVITENTSELCGIITKKDFITYMHQVKSEEC